MFTAKTQVFSPDLCFKTQGSFFLARRNTLISPSGQLIAFFNAKIVIMLFYKESKELINFINSKSLRCSNFAVMKPQSSLK
jgi:hypothetical protein